MRRVRRGFRSHQRLRARGRIRGLLTRQLRLLGALRRQRHVAVDSALDLDGELRNVSGERATVNLLHDFLEDR